MRTIILSTVLILLIGCGGGTLVVPQAPIDEVGIKITDRQVIESDGMYNSTPSVVEATNRTWVLTYLKGIGHVSSSIVIMRRSQDFGKTWGPEVQYFDTVQARSLTGQHSQWGSFRFPRQARFQRVQWCSIQPFTRQRLNMAAILVYQQSR